MREVRKEVLVVGAGPVGLWTALKLAIAGVEVKIIDAENRTAARSYACALHPRTLEALHKIGLAEPMIEKGRKVRTMAFYEGDKRCAEIDLSKAGGLFPFLLIVPQAAFETALEERLRQSGIHVDWMHRFDSFTREEESIAANVEELSGTSLGYVVPHWETTVRKQIPMRVQYIVGADGHQSLTRRRMNVEYQKLAGTDIFAAYEFESDETTDSEVRVVLASGSTSVLWPLPQNKWRWTFQVLASEGPSEFPEKERRAVRLADSVVDERVREYVQSIAAQRAPWFKANVKDVTWCTKVPFEQRLVSRFGAGRCWLVGDAAHQTGPVGVQSMNSGILEGEALSATLRGIIHDNADENTLEEYNASFTQTWQNLVGQASLKSDGKAAPWVADHARRILPCLPAIGPDLAALAAQLNLK